MPSGNATDPHPRLRPEAAEPTDPAWETVEPGLDRLIRAAAAAARAPAAGISRFTADRIVLQTTGLPEASARSIPLAGTPCERVGESRVPLLVSHLGRESLRMPPGTVTAYAGVPLLDADGHVLGTLWAADLVPRIWDEGVVAVLESLAAVCTSEIERVSEVLRAEERLRVQAVYLEHLFEAAPEGMVILDNQDRVVRANPEFTRMFGYSEREALGRRINDLIVPTAQLAEADGLTARARRGEVLNTELIRQRKDGSEIRVSLLASPIESDGGRIGLYAIYRDITERHRIEERFRSLIENAADAVVILSAGGAVEYASPSVERILGLSSDTLTGSNAFVLVHPDDAPEVIQRFSRITRGGRECDSAVEFRARHADGSWRILEARARNLLDDPALKGVVVNARDVTEERRAEHSRKRLNAFLEATPDFVATFDPHGRALSVNAAFRRIAGVRDDDDFSTLTIPDLYPPAATELILHEGIPTAVREGVWFGETLLLDRSGQEVPISQVILAHKTPTGAVEFLSTLARDITEQKRAERRVRQSELHFRSLIENALDIITVLDAEGGILFESPSVERVLGYSADELLGQSLLSLIHPDDAERAREVLLRREHAEIGAPVELRYRHKDGAWRVLESVSENLLGDPVVAGVVVNSRDVTERRAAEDALYESQQQLLQSQKMEAVGRLAGGVAHDFNNLLTAIKGFTELLLLDFDERDPRRTFISEIQSAANRAAALTRQLLAFSRKQVLQPKVLDLNGVVSDMDKMLRRLIGEDVAFETVLGQSLGRIKADPGQVEQVLMNLAVNARDAMPEGGRLTIRTANAVLDGEGRAQAPDAPAGSYVLLSVSDTGCGMSREVVERIFEPFFTTKEQGKGTGLGLSTVYGIVKQSGGQIEVDSELGVGTTFNIYLPAVEEEVVERRSEPRAESSLEGRETVLLVEDELAVRVLIRRVLDRRGYRVLEAEDGASALALLETHQAPVDLLLTDVVMPGMSGRELADHLTGRYPELQVLYMSGYTDEAIIHHGVLDPSVHFLEKPFTPDLLLRKLREVLDASDPLG